MKGKRKYTSILNGIETRQRINAIQKELFRKAIHMCAALVPLYRKDSATEYTIRETRSKIMVGTYQKLRNKGTRAI